MLVVMMMRFRRHGSSSHASTKSTRRRTGRGGIRQWRSRMRKGARNRRRKVLRRKQLLSKLESLGREWSGCLSDHFKGGGARRAGLAGGHHQHSYSSGVVFTDDNTWGGAEAEEAGMMTCCKSLQRTEVDVSILCSSSASL